MVLHGCKQTAQNMIDETGFRELARRKGFVVVYPFIKNYDGFRDQNCWGFWLDHHIHEGRGEVEDLYQIALEVERLGQDGPVRFALDPERRYVAGLSSGGAMAVVSAVAQSEYFAAAGSVAGLPYSETPSSVARSCFVEGSFKPVGDVVAAIRAEQRTAEERRPVPLMAIHSTNDCTVHERASENIRDAWLQLHGAATTPFETSDCAAEGVRCEHARYGRADRSVIETVFYEGQSGGFTGQGSHYWVGDNFGEFANPQGPSASALLWDFFERHSFGGNRPPSIAITAAAAQGTSVGVSGTANDDRAVAGVTVRLDGTHPQAARPASGTTSWSVTFDPVPNDAIYVPTATATDDQGRSTSATGRAGSGRHAAQPAARDHGRECQGREHLRHGRRQRRRSRRHGGRGRRGVR
jgi:poly(hydroxyalkanoate) depolymerase family esterase